jgi:hypothetical protein
MLGKPIFRGTRITVEFVPDRLAQGRQAGGVGEKPPPPTAEHFLAALGGA